MNFILTLFTSLLFAALPLQVGSAYSASLRAAPLRPVVVHITPKPVHPTFWRHIGPWPPQDCATLNRPHACSPIPIDPSPVPIIRW
jgi:hypothetical protein